MYADPLIQPWLDHILGQLPSRSIFDAHTHIGGNDDSISGTWDELVESLDRVDARAAVFPLHEPGGYRAANLECARVATESDGRLRAFVRLTPSEVSDGLLEESLAAGACGVKLHVSSDEFLLDDPRLERVYATADERRLPVLVHAGPEVDSMGGKVMELCHRWPGLRLILAHCAIADLGRLWRRVPEAPNLFFDTSWWTPAHLMALFRLIPPGRILGASDLPYCTPLLATLTTARCAWQAGLTPEQITSVIGGQFARLVDGVEPADIGPPPAHELQPMGPFQEIVSTNLLAALEAMQRGAEPGTPLVVARHGCDVEEDDPEAPVLRSVVRLLDLYEEHHHSLRQRNQFRPGWDIIATAAAVARTPSAPLP
ncbi:amidohydrolase family protein [Knoellia sp. Soil729]|uniref:amidohydrolase family protein n=1 Tax=Knoellia sp. Soil729 TaxID=1736394 RepID=UPI0006F623CA|nr:amidohydrolase family protein [Knoellia sp. Soil729]KRE40828.1 hypothetical protein ASG74_15230 [Knoellia sp. Soil729]